MHTYDDRLLRWDGELGFPIREPFVAQMPLGLVRGKPPHIRGYP